MPLHVYCVIGSKIEESLCNIGVGGHEVYTINYRDLAAVISDAPEKYDIIRDMKAHESVTEKMMERYVVLPLRFNQLAKSKEDVKGFLIENHSLLQPLLVRLKGKVELGIKLFWRLDKVLTKLTGESLNMRVLARQMAGLSEERAYPLKIKLGQMVEKELKGTGEKILKDAYSSLKPLSLDVKENELLTRGMIWNAAFLVDSSTEEMFDRAVEELERKYGDLLAFRYVRSPPYSFTVLKIGG